MQNATRYTATGNKFQLNGVHHVCHPCALLSLWKFRLPGVSLIDSRSTCLSGLVKILCFWHYCREVGLHSTDSWKCSTKYSYSPFSLCLRQNACFLWEVTLDKRLYGACLVLGLNAALFMEKPTLSKFSLHECLCLRKNSCWAEALTFVYIMGKLNCYRCFSAWCLTQRRDIAGTKSTGFPRHCVSILLMENKMQESVLYRNRCFSKISVTRGIEWMHLYNRLIWSQNTRINVYMFVLPNYCYTFDCPWEHFRQISLNCSSVSRNGVMSHLLEVWTSVCMCI